MPRRRCFVWKSGTVACGSARLRPFRHLKNRPSRNTNAPPVDGALCDRVAEWLGARLAMWDTPVRFRPRSHRGVPRQGCPSLFVASVYDEIRLANQESFWNLFGLSTGAWIVCCGEAIHRF